MPEVDTSSAPDSGRFWNEIGETCTEQHPDTLWRAHRDAVYAALVTCWLPAARLRRVLKTDLFDEAVAEGIYPVVHGRAGSIVGFDVSRRVTIAACRHYQRSKASSRCETTSLRRLRV